MNIKKSDRTTVGVTVPHRSCHAALLSRGEDARSVRGDFDPYLLDELRIGRAAQREDAASLRAEMAATQRKNTAAFREIVEELRRVRDAQIRESLELRRQSGRLVLYLVVSVVTLAFVAVFALIATRGVDAGEVSEAVRTVVPLVSEARQ